MLTKMTMVNSAGFSYSQIDLNGNTFLLGENGAGKTTTLRAILYFYTMNASKLGIDRNKKGFSNHYLKDKNSFILYTYKSKESFITAVAFSQENSGEVQFRFFHSPYNPELKNYFIEERKILDRGSVFERLGQDFSLSKIYSAAEARAIIFSKQKRDNTSFYNLFENGDEKTLGNMLSFVFSNKRVDDVTVKKAILASIPENFDNYGNLAALGSDINQFYQRYNDIKDYKKNEKKINTLSVEIIPKYEEQNATMQRTLSKILCSHKKASQAEQELDQKISELENVLTDLFQSKKTAEQNFSDQKINLSSKIQTEQRELDRFFKIEEKWSRSDIAQKIKAFKELESKKSMLADKKEAFDSLTKDIETQKENLKYRKQKLIAEHQQNIAKQKINLSKKEEKLRTLELENENKLAQILYRLGEEAKKERKHFLSMLEKNTEALNALYEEKRKIREKKLSDKMQEELSDLKTKQQALKQKQDLTTKELDQKYLSLKELLLQFRQETGNFEKEQDKALSPLYEKKAKATALLNPEPGSILEAASDNSTPFLKFLNVDALIQANVVKNKAKQDSSIFGIEVDTDAIKTPNFDIAVISNEIDRLVKQFNKKQTSIKSAFNRKKRLLEESIAQTEKMQQQLSQELLRTEKSIKDLEYKTLTAEKEFNQQKEEDLKEIDEKIATAKKEKTELKNQINQIDKQTLAKKESTKKELYQQMEVSRRSFVFEIGQLKNELAQSEKELQIRLQKMESEFNQGLGDKEKLLQKEILALEKFIDRVQKYAQEIQKYEYEQSLLSQKKSVETKIEHYQKELNIKQKKFNVLINEIQSNIKKIQADIKKHNQWLNSVRNEISAFAQFKNLNPGLLDEISPSDKCNESIISLVAQVARLKKEIEESGILIKKTVNSLDHIFNTSLNINRGSSTIEAAKALQQYHSKRMIVDVEDILQRDFMQYKTQVNSIYAKILDLKKEVIKTINSVNNDLNNPAITVIDSIKIRYISSDNKIVKALHKVWEVIEENDTESLFGSTGSDGVDALVSLAAAIKENEITKLSPEELFGLEFQVSERKNLSSWSQSLNNIGSEGTDILTKNLIYLSLLRRVKRRYSKKNIRVHLVLDEVGKLDSRFLSELIKKANNFGIYYVNASPDKKNVHQYKNVYFLKRGQSDKIVAIKQKLTN